MDLTSTVHVINGEVECSAGKHNFLCFQWPLQRFAGWFATRIRACAKFSIKTPTACTDFRRKFVPTNLQTSVNQMHGQIGGGGGGGGASYKTQNGTKWNKMKRNGKGRQKCGLWCSEMRLRGQMQPSLRLGGLIAGRQVTLARRRVH